MFQLLYLGLGFIGFFAVMQGGDIDASASSVAFSKLVFGLVAIALLGLTVPLLAVEARGLHDLNKSAWFLLLNLVPYIGVVVIYLVMLVDGDKGDNDFGPDPKVA